MSDGAPAPLRRLDRRSFFRLAGAGSLAVAAVTVPGAASVLPAATAAGGQLVFRSRSGLPARPASMATWLVEGQVDVARGTGTVTSRVLAGHPEPSQIALPGLTRVVRVTAVSEQDGRLQITGVVDDHSQLLPGESPSTELVVDRRAGTVTADLGRHRGTLTLD